MEKYTVAGGEKQQLALDILEHFKKELETYQFFMSTNYLVVAELGLREAMHVSMAVESCLRTAIIDWLKVFGSKNSPVFFNRFVEKRKFLGELALIEKNEKQFKDAVDAIREFRNIYLPSEEEFEQLSRYMEDAIRIAAAFKKLAGK